MKTTKNIYSILFLRGKTGASSKELSTLLKVTEKDIISLIEDLNKELTKSWLPLIIKINGNKYRLTIKDESSKDLAILMDNKQDIRLPKPTLEVLTIIAYKQPSTKPEIEKIRGVNSDNSIKRLIDFELIEECGRATTPGTPILYKTTNNFLELFDLKSLKDLPKLTHDLEANIINAGNLFDHE